MRRKSSLRRFRHPLRGFGRRGDERRHPCPTRSGPTPMRVACAIVAGAAPALVVGSMLFLLALALALGAKAQSPPLPEGASGIAAAYPGDRGIEHDPRVLFVERFDEASVDALCRRWGHCKGRAGMALVRRGVEGSADGRSLLITHVGGRGTGSGLYHRLRPGRKRVFARFYVRFDPDCAPIHHLGTALGGYRPPTDWPQGGAGLRPNGSERFTTWLDPYGRRWRWDFYTYWQGMHVHGDGHYWGTPFLQGVPKPAVARGRWIGVELMVKLNDPPSARNGEQAFWIDGRLWRAGGQVVSRVGPGFPRGHWTGGWWHPDPRSPSTFEGFRWRSVDDLLVNFVWAYVYITDAPTGHVSRIGFDNIVVATDYVGPLEPLRGSKPAGAEARPLPRSQLPAAEPLPAEPR